MIFDNALLLVHVQCCTCQAQKCTFTPWRRRCNVMQRIVDEELAQGPTWRIERNSNLRPSGRKAPNPTTEPTTPPGRRLKQIIESKRAWTNDEELYVD